MAKQTGETREMVQVVDTQGGVIDQLPLGHPSLIDYAKSKRYRLQVVQIEVDERGRCVR